MMVRRLPLDRRNFFFGSSAAAGSLLLSRLAEVEDETFAKYDNDRVAKEGRHRGSEAAGIHAH